MTNGHFKGHYKALFVSKQTQTPHTRSHFKEDCVNPPRQKMRIRPYGSGQNR